MKKAGKQNSIIWLNRGKESIKRTWNQNCKIKAEDRKALDLLIDGKTVRKVNYRIVKALVADKFLVLVGGYYLSKK